MVVMKFVYMLKSDFHDLDQVIERSLLFPEISAGVLKMINILEKQEKITSTTLILKDTYCVPQNSLETQTQKTFDNRCRY